MACYACVRDWRSPNNRKSITLVNRDRIKQNARGQKIVPHNVEHFCGIGVVENREKADLLFGCRKRDYRKVVSENTAEQREKRAQDAKRFSTVSDSKSEADESTDRDGHECDLILS